ncbi:hypothetical protein AAMO2058_000309300 [Amorphochlora amoebiformis]
MQAIVEKIEEKRLSSISCGTKRRSPQREGPQKEGPQKEGPQKEGPQRGAQIGLSPSAPRSNLDRRPKRRRVRRKAFSLKDRFVLRDAVANLSEVKQGELVSVLSSWLVNQHRDGEDEDSEIELDFESMETQQLEIIANFLGWDCRLPKKKSAAGQQRRRDVFRRVRLLPRRDLARLSAVLDPNGARGSQIELDFAKLEPTILRKVEIFLEEAEDRIKDSRGHKYTTNGSEACEHKTPCVSAPPNRRNTPIRLISPGSRLQIQRVAKTELSSIFELNAGGLAGE